MLQVPAKKRPDTSSPHGNHLPKRWEPQSRENLLMRSATWVQATATHTHPPAMQCSLAAYLADRAAQGSCAEGPEDPGRGQAHGWGQDEAVVGHAAPGLGQVQAAVLPQPQHQLVLHSHHKS